MQWRGDPLLGWSQSADAAAAPGSASRDCRKECHWSSSSPTQSNDAAATPGSAVALKNRDCLRKFQRKFNENRLQSRETKAFSHLLKQRHGALAVATTKL